MNVCLVFQLVPKSLYDVGYFDGGNTPCAAQQYVESLLCHPKFELFFYEQSAPYKNFSSTLAMCGFSYYLLNVVYNYE